MLLESITLPIHDQVFTHVDGTTNVNTVFAVSRLREHCLRTRHPLCMIPIETWAAHMIYENRGIEIPRFRRALSTRTYAPLLFLDMPDGTQLLVDGSHTYVARFCHKHKWALAYIVRQSVWRDFILADFPTYDMTKDQLLSSHSGIF